jgi:hypothetical protein
MGKLEQQLSNVRLGSHCWCVLKTTIVDAAKTEKPEFLIHLTRGYVASKGIQQNDDGTVTAFVEIAGQRVKASHVFKTHEQAISRASEMMAEIADGIKALPPQS